MPSKHPATRRRLASLGLHAPRADAFAVHEPGVDLVYEWHSHGHHQLLYAFSGSARVETKEGVWLLPPFRAAWIPSGTTHRTALEKISSGSLFFAPGTIASPDGGVRIIEVPPLLREMIAHAMRWPESRDLSDPRANAFFPALASLIADGLKDAAPSGLPAAKTAPIRRAMDLALKHPDTADCAAACAKAAMSERTFRRRFSEEAGMSWKEYLRRARMLRAAEMLAEGRGVLDTALDVGFDSPGAFAKAFRSFSGRTPKAFSNEASGAVSRRKTGTTRHA